MAELNLFGIKSEFGTPKHENDGPPLLPAKAKLERDFSKVILTLHNVLIPEDKLSPTPSQLDGVPENVEIDLKIFGSELIQTSGILLDLPQVAMATGQVLFQRFYYCKSFVKHSVDVVAMACIHLASKIEEAPRRIRDVIAVFHHMKQIRNQKTITSLVLDPNYITLKNQVIKEERRVLKELGFCCHVKHPHKMIVMYLQVLEAERNRRLLQCAWNYMNDSFRSNVFIRFNPETIACSCIYLAARQLQIALPNNPPWYALFGVLESDIKDICLSILSLYTRSKPNPEQLEKVINDLKLQLKTKSNSHSGEAAAPASAPGTPSNKHRDSSTPSAPGSASKEQQRLLIHSKSAAELHRVRTDSSELSSRYSRPSGERKRGRDESTSDKYRNKMEKSTSDKYSSGRLKRSRSPSSSAESGHARVDKRSKGHRDESSSYYKSSSETGSTNTSRGLSPSNRSLSRTDSGLHRGSGSSETRVHSSGAREKDGRYEKSSHSKNDQKHRAEVLDKRDDSRHHSSSDVKSKISKLEPERSTKESSRDKKHKDKYRHDVNGSQKTSSRVH